MSKTTFFAYVIKLALIDHCHVAHISRDVTEADLCKNFSDSAYPPAKAGDAISLRQSNTHTQDSRTITRHARGIKKYAYNTHLVQIPDLGILQPHVQVLDYVCTIISAICSQSRYE